MKFSDCIKTAFRNLNRRKARTFLTSFAVAIGAMLILVMVSLGTGIQQMVIDTIKKESSLTKITVSSSKENTFGVKVITEGEEKEKNDFKMITEENIKKIKNMKNVEDIQIKESAFISETLLDGKSKTNVQASGYDLKYSVFPKSQVDAVRIKEKDNKIQPITVGRELEKSDKNAVLVSEEYLNKLGIKDYKSVLGKELSINVDMSEMEGESKIVPITIKSKVVGIVNKKISNDEIILPIQSVIYIQGYLSGDKDYYNKKGPQSVLVYVNDYKNLKSVSDSIEKMGYNVHSFDTIVKQVKTFFSIFQGILAIVGIIVLLVASLGVINTMTMSIYERTRSIGILKALGASKGDIRLLFITESGAIGFIGGIMGLIFGWINTKVVKVVLAEWLKSKGVTDIPNLFLIQSWLIFAVLGFSMLMAIIAGLYPAGKASKLDPVESLKYE